MTEDYKYFSWYCDGQQPESTYQIKKPTLPNKEKTQSLKESFWNDNKSFWNDKPKAKRVIHNSDESILNKQAKANFKSVIQKYQPVDICSFLDFHYRKYIESYPGNELNFFTYINENSEYYGKVKLSAARREIILDWIEGKKNPNPVFPSPEKKPNPEVNFISFLVMDENKKQPFADKLKSNFKNLTGKELAIMFNAAKKYINIKNLKALLENWQVFVNVKAKRDEAMNKAMRTIKNYPAYYAKESNKTSDQIENIYKSIV